MNALCQSSLLGRRLDGRPLDGGVPEVGAEGHHHLPQQVVLGKPVPVVHLATADGQRTACGQVTGHEVAGHQVMGGQVTGGQVTGVR